jgi:eukaryotic-like serine/threonine-protein kinase
MDNRWQQIEELYHAAKEQPQDQRAAFLQLRCGSDNVLRQEVESLLVRDAQVRGALDYPAWDGMESLLHAVIPADEPGDAPIPVGTEIGPYRITEVLGAGGMGRVYRADDTRLGRAVAVKVSKMRFSERFDREARVIAALNHPNICQLYDVGPNFLVMEFVEGTRLAGGYSLRETISIVVQIAEGLAAAHAAGITHRDLKPDNILLTRAGHVKIVDFGLAKVAASCAAAASAEPGALLSEPGVVMGTVEYMSPEQVRGQQADHRSDIFSLGLIVYEMLAGRRAFTGGTSAEIMTAILKQDPPELPESVPVLMRRIVVRCLEKDPANRFQSAKDLGFALAHSSQAVTAAATAATDIEGLRVKDKISARPLPLEEALNIATGGKRTWKVLVPAAAAVLSLALGATWWATRQSPAKPMGPPVIAVRSFRYISSDRGQEYVSSGISEEIRSQLSKISSVRVLARSAVDRYLDTDLSRMTAELGATRIVEGTIQIEKQRLRASVELTDAVSRQSLWAEQYDRTVDDVLALQGELAVRIAEAMRTQISPEEQRRLKKRPTENPAAWDLFLQSRKRGTNREQRIALLERAVEIDPKFAQAMAAIAYNTVFDPVVGFAKAAEAQIWAERAAAADPELPQAHGALAIVHAARGMNSQAKAELLKAIELDPNGGAYMNLAAVLTDSGQLDEGLHWARIALERNPRASIGYYHVAYSLLEMRDDAATEQWLSIWRQRSPNFRLPVIEALLKVEQGKVPEALAAARKIVASAPENREYASLLADLSLVAGAPDAEKLNRDYFRGSDEVSFVNQCYLVEPPKVRGAYFAQKQGDPARAKRLLEEAEATAMNHWRQGVDVLFLPVQLASIRALQGDTNGALDWLQRAYDRGWIKAQATRLDPMLASLRGNPRFEGLVQRMQDDVARMRRHTTEIRALFEKSVPALPPPAPPSPQPSK